ncbi:L-rhamnose mutarotase [Pinibacter soli]|uniref:L-rhamnose mutarotase n=1 Tax=Pinibacter soli TaxID=3044211 RepID=A0ABT6REK5_9BACT|nr:L-rhamnose mutarotase [Pinibacter soli]MDI3321009.1 L-rhamnose mutarotase [Pinibacter soli]
MKKFCLTLDLKNDDGLIEAYEKYHRQDSIWPEIPEGIKACGILSMDIYRVSTRLVMIMETDDEFELKSGFEKMAGLPRQQEWAALMNTMQEKPAFAEPGEHWVLMKQVFKL